MHGNDQDREAEAPENALPEVAAEASVIQVSPFRWGGRGNIVTAVGIALLDLAKVR
ncbi:MAG: hypothetical protein ABW003_17555 [Microvirga sp.]